jgi:hypothetical protein
VEISRVYVPLIQSNPIVNKMSLHISEEADSLSIPRPSLGLHEDDQSTSLQLRGDEELPSLQFTGDDQRPSLQIRGDDLRLDEARLLARVKQLLLNPKFMRLLVGFAESQQQQQQRGVNKG